MKLKPIWIIIISVSVISIVAFYKVMQPPMTSIGPEIRKSGANPESIGLAPGRVTMIDLGATECVPCKMMAPILEELKKEYDGKADIIFIDVWKDPSQAKKFGIRAIPTQIFFDAEGREFYRHTGFMDKKRIVDILSRLGVS
jgi:thioredoxin 1